MPTGKLNKHIFETHMAHSQTGYFGSDRFYKIIQFRNDYMGLGNRNSIAIILSCQRMNVWNLCPPVIVSEGCVRTIGDG